MTNPRPLPCLALAVFLLAGTSVALAQSSAPPPPQLQPLPEISPAPGVGGDPDLEPQVTISRKEGETVAEARVNGRLVWIKVTPRHGKSYFLIPDANGHTIRRDSLDTGLKVPLWVLFEF